MKNFIFNQTENRWMSGVTVRRILLSMCFIAFACACFAQDIIVTKDSKRIEAKVTEINADDIKYKLFDNQDGPVYSLLKSNIVTIIYQNGMVEIFEQETATATTTVTTAPAVRSRTAPTVVAAQSTSTYNPAQRRLTTAETLLAMQVNYPRLYSQWRSGQRMKGVGWGLTGVGIGSLICGIAIVVDGTDNGDEEQEVAGAVIATAGVCLITGGVTVLAIGAGKRRRAISAFNNQYYSLEQSAPQFQFNVYPNRVGLAYVF